MHDPGRYCTFRTIPRGPGLCLPRVTDGVRRALVIGMHQSQQIATEIHDLPAHAHRTGELHGKEDHLTGHERSRQALEHSNKAYLTAQTEHQQSMLGHGGEISAHDATQHEIAALAYKLWQGRGCPDGSSEADWHDAVEQLRPRD